MALFEGYERRIDQINAVLNSYGISSIEEAEKITKDAGLDVYDQVKKIQPICFENACWAYTVGAAIAIKKGCTRAADAAAAIGEGLQAFCIPGSVADHRKVGLGHGNLGKMLLEEETECFCFLAGHESFAAAEGAIGIAEKANKVRQKPLRVILNGLGKDAAQIISRINGFTFVETQYDYKAAKLNVVYEKAYSDGLRATVKCYGADDVQEAGGLRAAQGQQVHDPRDDGAADDGRNVIAAREVGHEVVERGHDQHRVRHEGETVADPVAVGHEEADELAEALLGVRVQAVRELGSRGRQDAERVRDEPDADAGDDPGDDDGSCGGVCGHVLGEVVDASADHGADDDADEADQPYLLRAVGCLGGASAGTGRGIVCHDSSPCHERRARWEAGARRSSLRRGQRAPAVMR